MPSRRRRFEEPKPDPRRRLLPETPGALAEGCPCKAYLKFEDEVIYAVYEGCPIHGFTPLPVEVAGANEP